MGALLNDLRFGFRMLWKAPLFTGVAVLALALGIGTNTAIFSLINAYLLSPLPFAQPEQLVTIWQANQRRGTDHDPVSYPNFADIQQDNQVFDRVAAYNLQQFTLTVNAAEPERIQGGKASADLFPLLDIQPLMGRTFLPEEDQRSGNRVVVLSHGLWQRGFGGSSSILGQVIMLDAEAYTVVGIMPASFRFPVQAPVSLWVPLGPTANREARGMRSLQVLARLKPGQTVEKARADVNTIARRLQQEYPGTNADWGLNVISLHEDITKRAKPALLLLFGVVGFVLLIACANVANLLLARAVARQKEIAIRIALGAGRVRLIRQLLTESMLLSLFSGAVGFVLALVGLNVLLARAPEVNLGQSVGLDLNVLLFTLVASIVAAAIFGLLPALQTSKPDLNDSLKEGGRDSSGGFGGRLRLRSLLIVFEVALSLILLIGAGMMIKSFLNLQRVNPGFDAGNVLVVPVALPQNKYPEAAQRALFFQQAVERIAALQTVESVGATNLLPLAGEDRGQVLNIEGRPLPPGEKLYASTRDVTPDYFRTMRIPIISGRDFTRQDTADTMSVVLINETMAKRYFANEDPVGKRVSLVPGQGGPWLTIVGVVGDTRHTSLSIPPTVEAYGPHAQDPIGTMTIVIRTSSDPSNLANLVRNELRAMDSSLPLLGMRTMEQTLKDSVAPVQASMTLLTLFAVLALLLAVMGIFAFISYAVTQRTHEIGVRMALGAQRHHVLMLIVSQGLRLVLVGIALGLVGAFFLTRLMVNLLYGVSPLDLVTFAGVSLLLVMAALLATIIPAAKATKLDPVIALRSS
jgi:predicted permease